MTLTGTGGTGKTRLGLQVAAELSDAFPDGVFFVNLAPISDPELVVPTIVQTLDVKEIADQPPLGLLKAFLYEKRLLLLLDNFEQVVDAAVYVAELLSTCPQLKVIVTSRAVLHIRGEQEFVVPPLQLPGLNRLPDLVSLSQYEAVALFIQRAQAVKPEFQLTTANAQAVAEICIRLDGLPLAIELAAARINVLPPQALLTRLGQRLAVLTSGARDVPARQQTLRNTIEWSYQLLDAEEQRLFRRFSVFVGGCTLEAIEAVCRGAGDDTINALNTVASLIGKSLLQQTEQDSNEPRLVMLETIREYGLEVLATSGEMEVIRQAHAEYYLSLAEAAEPELVGLEQFAWIGRLEREYVNLQAAVRWSLEQGEAGHSMEIALRLGGALQAFWGWRGYFNEGLTYLDRALAKSEGSTALVQAKAILAAADLAFDDFRNLDRVEALAEKSLALYRELKDTAGVAYSLYRKGRVALTRSNYAEARSLLEEALALFKEVGNQERVATSLNRLGFLDVVQGNYARGSALLEESLAMHRKLGNKAGMANSLRQLAQLLFLTQGDPMTARALLDENLVLIRESGDRNAIASSIGLSGQIALSQGDTVTARRLVEEGLRLYRELGNQPATAEPLTVLAMLEADQGDLAAARTIYEESLTLAVEVGDKINLSLYLEGLAAVVVAQGEPALTARLLSVADALREAINVPLPPVYRAEHEQSVAAAHAQLGEKAFAAAWAEGQTMRPKWRYCAWWRRG